MEILDIETKKGRKYIILIEPLEGVKLWKQPEKADIDPEKKIAYVRSVEWGITARRWALENGYGGIKIKLDPLKISTRPRGRPRKHAKVTEAREVSGDA